MLTAVVAGREVPPDDRGAPAAQVRTSSIAGRIIRPDGAAAENARVAVYPVRNGAPVRTAAVIAASSYDGRYEITGLPAGTYIVGVTPSAIAAPTPNGVARPSPTETFYPDTPDAQRSPRIVLIAGVPVEGIDVWLLPAPQRYTVSGRVYMPEGVEARQLIIEYGGRGVVRRGLWHVYDPGGLFDIEGVAQGPLVLLARAETDRGTYMGVASTMVTVESVQDVRIVMRRPGRIQGRVVFERELPRGAGELRISPVQTLLTLSALYPVPDVPVARDGTFDIPETLGTYTFELRGLPEGWSITRADAVVVGAEQTVTGVEVFAGPGPT